MNKKQKNGGEQVSYLKAVCTDNEGERPKQRDNDLEGIQTSGLVHFCVWLLQVPNVPKQDLAHKMNMDSSVFLGQNFSNLYSDWRF